MRGRGKEREKEEERDEKEKASPPYNPMMMTGTAILRWRAHTQPFAVVSFIVQSLHSSHVS